MNHFNNVLAYVFFAGFIFVSLVSLYLLIYFPLKNANSGGERIHFISLVIDQKVSAATYEIKEHFNRKCEELEKKMKTLLTHDRDIDCVIRSEIARQVDQDAHPHEGS